MAGPAGSGACAVAEVDSRRRGGRPRARGRNRRFLAQPADEARHGIAQRQRIGACGRRPVSDEADGLIDDSDGVRMEGERHGFRVLVVKPGDEEWAQKIPKALKAH